ncbi:MAG: hypothetical protein HWE12_02540 [Oceanospirillaceae bacterium]|nr:hypothetical protein [Oceanospirillaceae bacterium]
MKVSPRNIYPFFFVSAAIIPASPIFSYYTDFSSPQLYMVFFGLTVCTVLIARNSINSKYLLLSVFLVITLLIESVYWQDSEIAIWGKYLISSILLVGLLSKEGCIKIVNNSYYGLSLMAIFGIIAQIYVLSGGDALLVISNPDGRSAYLFPGTMTNWWLGSFIRPAGTFDEPGSFAFYLAIILAARVIIKKQGRSDIYIATLALSTLSVAYFLFYLLYLFQSGLGYLAKFLLGVAILTLIIPGAYNYSSLLVERFEIVDGSFKGNNRNDLIHNSLNIVKNGNLLFGTMKECMVKSEICVDAYGSYGANPLTLQAAGGIIFSLPYYALILFFLYKASIVKRLRYIVIGLLIVFFVKPYIYSLAYSLIMMLLIRLLMIKMEPHGKYNYSNS